MSVERPGYFTSHVITTDPLRLPEGAVVRIGAHCTHQAALEQAIREIYDLRTERGKRNATVASLIAENERLASIGFARGQMVDGLRAELARVTGDYDAVCKDIDDERQRNANATRSLQEDAATIASLRSQLARAEAKNATQGEMIAGQSETIGRLEKELNAVRGEKAQLEKVLAKREETIGHITRSNADLDSEVDNLRSKLCSANAKTKDADQRLDRADAIEAKAKEVLATYIQCGPKALAFVLVLGKLASEVGFSFAPEAAKPDPSPKSCPACGSSRVIRERIGDRAWCECGWTLEEKTSEGQA